MKAPSRFTGAMALATTVMALTYVALGAVGYRSQGLSVSEIIIFGLGCGIMSRLAAGFILFQASLPSQHPCSHNSVCVS